MKPLLFAIAGIALGTSAASAQITGAFTNMIRQVQLPYDGSPGTVEMVNVGLEGQQLSPLEINPGGARFELWTFPNDGTLTEYLVDHKLVSADTPIAQVAIITEDPYKVIPRTRADRLFEVVVETQGLHPDVEDAAPSLKGVRLMRHVQSYGPEGVGEGIDRSEATLLQEVLLERNQIYRFVLPVTAIPGDDRAKVRGEERYSVYSIEDLPRSASDQLGSMFLQVWPVANAMISGITNGETLRFNTPQITLTYEDLYPDSRTYAQLYPGAPALGTEGRVVAGSAIVIYDAVPHNRTLVLNDWDTLIDQDGQWTLELLTATPFGIDRLAYVTFNINRSIEVQGSITTGGE